MNASLALLGFAVATGSLTLAAGRRWQSATPTTNQSVSHVPPVPAFAEANIADSLAVVEQVLASSDPFRISHVPAALRFDPLAELTSSPSATVSVSVRPTLVLKAIVGGPPWEAAIDGIPGQQPGTIVRVGSVFDKLAVRTVTRDSVVIRGPDTTWTLVFRSHP